MALPNTLAGSLLSLRKKKVVPPPPSGAPPIDKNDYVKLISKEGHVFILERRCATVSKLIKGFLSGQALASTTPDVAWNPAEEDQLHFPFVPAQHLEKAIEYFHYKTKYDHSPDNRPDFHVPWDSALELIKVATMLQC